MTSEPIRDPFPAAERAAEVKLKRDAMEEFLASRGLDALLVARHENIAWATAGLVEVRVASVREVGAASLLFTRGGGSFYLTTNNEAPRLADEEFRHVDFQPVTQPWYAANVLELARRTAPGTRLAADDPGFELPVASMKPLRSQLTDTELARYRWLGSNVAAVVTEALPALRPGVPEAAMQAMMAERLLARRILPSVMLTAVDDRIRRYRHAVPREGVLEHLGMLNLCARRWGLVVSITRYVHFGAMPAELEDAFAAAAHVNVALLRASREGATADELFSVAKEAYAESGYPGEEQMHHQGGASGYWEREWIARPGGTEAVLDRQAMAWNPSVRGAKIEDTVIVSGGRPELLTPTPRLPQVDTQCGDFSWRSAGVLRA